MKNILINFTGKILTVIEHSIYAGAAQIFSIKITVEEVVGSRNFVIKFSEIWKRF